MKANLLFVIALLSAGLASGANLQAPVHAYTVQGNVELKTIRWSTNNAGSFYYDFETNYFDLQVQDRQWLVKLGSNRPEVFDYRIISSDDTDTFQLLSYETRLKKRVLRGEEPIRNVGDGAVDRGNIPHFDLAPEAGAIWIAYVSWDHFATEPHNHRRPVPFADYVSMDGPRFYGKTPAVEDAFWQLSDSLPHVPTTLVYAAENTTSADGSTLKGTDAAKTFTNVLYQVLAFTDCDGLRLPKESVVSINRLFRTQSGITTNQFCQRLRVIATNVIKGVKLESFEPKLLGKTTISEFRFATNGTGVQFTYERLFSPDDGWPSESASRASEDYRKAKWRLTGEDEDFLRKGTNAPNISMLWLSGGKQKMLSDYQSKVKVLEFWATWCAPCQTAMEKIQTYVEKYPNRKDKVALITLSVDEDREVAETHVLRKGWNKTDNFWVNRKGVKAYPYPFEGIPMVYIVDEQGKIAAAGHFLDIPRDVNRLLRESGP
jgi:thiol-disulfide isomerase/thioredoxin